MAKSIKSKAAALKQSTATIGDNSSNAPKVTDTPESRKLLNDIAKLGAQYREGAMSANRMQLNAAISFGNAVKSKIINDGDDAVNVVKAFAPHLYDVKLAASKQAPAFKVLLSQFRSFANPKVLDCATYDHVDAARGGKDFFTAAYRLNVAIKNAESAKPNVNAAFTAKALEKTVAEPAKKDRSKAGMKKAADKAIKRLVAALAEFKAKSVRNALSDLTAAQSKALDAAIATFI